MSKRENEITMRIYVNTEKFCKILENKDFKVIDEFYLKDYYFIPNSLDIKNMSAREILQKAILIRDINNTYLKKQDKKLTFKVKEFDNSGNILSQEAFDCEVLDIEKAKLFIRAIGYKEIMIIEEQDIVYDKDNFSIAIKDIKNGDKLIEIETKADNPEMDTIEKLKDKLEKLELPLDTNDYFVKKAEIELKKII